MPIRFHCYNCRQFLKIATRKSGTAIECPQCRVEILVPYYSEAKPRRRDSRPFVEIVPPPFCEESSSQNTFVEQKGYVSEPELAAPPVVEQEDFSSEFTTETLFPPDEMEGFTQQDQKNVLLDETFAPTLRRKVPPRTPVSTTVIVGFVVGVIESFAIGVMFGVFLVSPDRLLEVTSKDRKSQLMDAIIVDGKVTYLDSNGVTQNDNGALVIFLPQNPPQKLISPGGLSLREASPSLANPNLSELVELGGYYTRTDSQGDFFLTITKPGKYHLLLVSAHTTHIVSDFSLDEVSGNLLAKYFDSPETLIGESRYSLTEVDIQRGVAPLENRFPASEKDIESAFIE